MGKKLFISLFLVLFLIIIIVCPNSVQATSLDDIMNGADNFVQIGESTSTIDASQLGSTSGFIYNILLGISMVIAVVVGLILGIKYMVAESEDKAGIKETLVPYVVACVITFGAFTIWKIVINILQ